MWRVGLREEGAQACPPLPGRIAPLRFWPGPPPPPVLSNCHTHTALPTASAVYSRPQKGGRLTRAPLPRGRLSPSLRTLRPLSLLCRGVSSWPFLLTHGPWLLLQRAEAHADKIRATRKGEAPPEATGADAACDQGHPVCPAPDPAGSPTGWLQESSLGFALQSLAEASRMLQVSREASSPCLVPSRGAAGSATGTERAAGPEVAARAPVNPSSTATACGLPGEISLPQTLPWPKSSEATGWWEQNGS